MADKQSREVKVTTLECMVCGYREVFTERQFLFTDGLRCNQCDSPVQPSVTRPGEKLNNRRMKKQDHTSSANGLNVKVNVDVSEAIKGLKAMQREAKRTTAALKELEEQRKRDMVLPTGYRLGCSRCGSMKLERELHTANSVVEGSEATCKDCGWVE